LEPDEFFDILISRQQLGTGQPTKPRLEDVVNMLKTATNMVLRQLGMKPYFILEETNTRIHKKVGGASDQVNNKTI
jgi:hypothetical protein